MKNKPCFILKGSHGAYKIKEKPGREKINRKQVHFLQSETGIKIKRSGRAVKRSGRDIESQIVVSKGQVPSPLSPICC